MQKLHNLIQFIRRQPRWRLAVAAGLVVILGLFALTRGGKTAGRTLTFAARRGPLEITVLEGGSLQALESQEVKCEVRVGYQGSKILRIVDEGYLVTDEDVKTNKVLVELDSSDLQKQIVQQEIQYQSAVASLIDAQQNYEIQLNQNQSDVKAAEQKARFARLDFDKFLGDTVTGQIVQDVGLDKMLAAASTNDVKHTARAQAAFSEKAEPPVIPGFTPGADPSAPASAILMVKSAAGGTNPRSGAAGLPQDATASPGNVTLVKLPGGTSSVVAGGQTPAAAVPAPGSLNPAGVPKLAPGLEAAIPTMGNDEDDSEAGDLEMTNKIVVDFSKYAKLEALGDGEAKQKLRNFEDDLQVAEKELGQAKATLEGTKRLADKGFVTKLDLQRDEIAYDNSRLKVQTADSARDLFLKYDFLKTAEQGLSTYAEAVRELDKARRVAISRAAQAKARLKSAQGQYQVQSRQRSDMYEQLEKCTMRAKKTGLVVYGGSRDDMVYYGGEERIREGATVRERQAIITIPDLSRMAVNVKIHESYIKKIKKGQKARITVDAFPDKTLTGEVTKVGVLPDSGNRWMNPDMKVYVTSVTIDGTQDWVKPGMSAKVEILVNRIEDCVYIPVQAVSPDGDKQVCYLARGVTPERREVAIGDFNDEFIEIKSGIKEGERVLLRPPDGVETEPISAEPKDAKPGQSEAPKAAPAPAPAPAPSRIAQAKKG